MNAKDARRLNDEFAKTQMLDIDSITEFASKGRTGISISLTKIEYSYRDRTFVALKKDLVDRGFKVTRHQWSDQRDGDSGDDMVIKW